MSEPKFFNTNGDLSLYSFACGYVQDFESATQKVELYFEGACYHVRAFNHHKCKFSACGWNGEDRARLWFSFDGLIDARKLYRKFVTKIKKGETI